MINFSQSELQRLTDEPVDFLGGLGGGGGDSCTRTIFSSDMHMHAAGMLARDFFQNHSPPPPMLNGPPLNCRFSIPYR